MSDDRRRYPDHAFDQISLEVGKLQAQMEESARQRAEIFNLLHEILSGMSEVKGLVATVRRHDVEIEGFKKLKWKLGGAATALGAGGATAVWAAVKNWLQVPPGGP